MRHSPLLLLATLSISSPLFAQPAQPPPAQPPPPAEPPPAQPPPAQPVPPTQPVPPAPAEVDAADREAAPPATDEPAAATAPDPTLDSSLVPTTTTAEQDAKVAEPPPPKKLAVGRYGLFQPSALLQGWFFASFMNATDEATPPGGEEWITTFRIRRAEIHVKGEIVPDFIGYKLMIDPAKVLEADTTEKEVEGQEPAPTTPGTVSVREAPSTVSVFQDFFITFMSEYADVSLGQFKNPVSWEGYQSSSKLLFPERALSSRAFGDQRDIGLRVEKKLGPVYYYAGFFNGTGLNRRDNNDQKDAALRVEVFPLEWLMVGAVGYTSIGERDQPTTRDLIEGDLRVEYMNALLQAEYIRQWLGQEDDPAGGERRHQGQGFYGALAYTFLDRYQPAIRIGAVDDDIYRKDDHVWHYEIGFNYYFEKNEAKLQASYSLVDPARSCAAVDATGGNCLTRHELIAAAQVSF